MGPPWRGSSANSIRPSGAGTRAQPGTSPAGRLSATGSARRPQYPQPHWNPPTHVGFSRTPWFKVLAVGLVVLAVMPGSSASAKFETISLCAIIGVVAYFVFRSATFALSGTVRGSAVPPANQTNAGNPSPPGAAPAAAAVPYAYAPPGRVPVRQPGAPRVRRWTMLDPDTLRSVPLRQRFSELMLSLTYATFSTALIVGGLYWATGSLPIGRRSRSSAARCSPARG